jgi:ComF family protein
MQALKRAQAALLDIFYPRLCVGCGLHGAWVCDACSQNLPLFSMSGFPNPEGRVPSFALYSYDARVVRRIVHALKYEGTTELAGFMARAMGRWWKRSPILSALLPSSVVFMPIPLHEKKLRERGWNQAELIARELAAFLGFSLETGILVRTLPTLAQSSLSRRERLLNMRGAFSCRPSPAVKGGTVILIDDVMTTGATLAHAARALRANGITDVRAFVFARGDQ